MVGVTNMMKMVDVAHSSSEDDPFCMQSIPVMAFDQAPINNGEYLDFRADLFEDVMMYVIDEDWSIVPHSLST